MGTKRYFSLARVMSLTLLVVSLFLVNSTFAQDHVEVQIEPGGISAVVNSVPDFVRVKLLVVDPEDEVLCDKATKSSSIFWALPGNAMDGVYRYEVIVLTYDPDADSGQDDGPTGEHLIRKHDTFRVRGGVIVVPEKPAEREMNQTLWKRIREGLEGAMAELMDFLVPKAEASDLTASSYMPTVYFDDTDIAGNYEWYLRSYEAGDSIFELQDSINGNEVISITNSANDSYSLSVLGNGDINLANDAVFIDRSAGELSVTGRIGIGTTTPVYDLDIYDPVPEIQLKDSSDDTIAHIQYNSYEFAIEGGTQQDIVEIDTRAPEHSFQIDQDGFSLFNWAGSFTGGDGLRTILSLSSSNSASGKTSDVGFILKNLPNNFQWTFRTYEPDQGFSATKLGTGGAELIVKNSTNDYTKVSLYLGNGAYCSSTGQWVNASSKEYKENIEPVTIMEAMDILKGLNPVKFNFKKDETKRKYLGFIAEDVPDAVGTPDRKGINSTQIVAVLTKAVQGQQKKIEELKAEVRKLKAREASINNLSEELAQLKKQVYMINSLARK